MDNRWNILLTPETFRKRTKTIPIDKRNPFEQDYGRLISSAPIRRLQDKTQVYPLEQSDYIRTRLTHSLEVSNIGSSIGTSIEKILIEKELYDPELSNQLSSLLRVAGLIHDIGNPPFGHFGEEAIKDFFVKFFNTNQLIGLSKQEKEDYINFDGNIQAFRILRRLYWFKDENSFNLTFPVFATITKYPANSIDGNKGKKTNEIRLKKYGYYPSEEADYKAISETLKLNLKRHPAAYLLEAADDIAYCAADIEDGVKLGAISYEKIKDVFTEKLDNNKDLIEIFDKIYQSTDKNIGDSLMFATQQLRVIAQGKMIDGVISTFVSNYEKIMTGEVEDELLYLSNASDIRQAFKELGKIVYNDKQITQIELAGWEAIQGLLGIFISGIMEETPQSSRLYRNISSSYRYIFEKYPNQSTSDQYNKIQLIVDFISGMTDSYAISLYQRLKGIKL